LASMFHHHKHILFFLFYWTIKSKPLMTQAKLKFWVIPDPYAQKWPITIN
jgi:hypothetical protein